MKGFGTDEAALIRALTQKDPLQIEAIKAAFKTAFSRDLMTDIVKETAGDLEYGLVSVVRGPLLSDVHELYNAMTGPCTKETVLNDVLLSRSNADMNALKSTYQRTFHRRLEDDLKADLSGKTERHFLIVIGATRAEDAAPVVPQQVDQDVLELYKATEGKVGTDEVLVSSILSTRNDAQIRAIADTYRQRYSRDLEEVIKKVSFLALSPPLQTNADLLFFLQEFSGHLESAMLFQLRHARDKYMHAASLLYDTMVGAGTKEKLLTARLVRFHWDRNMMQYVKMAYQQRYGKSLAQDIKKETSGDYEKFLLGCIWEF
jgi:annexin A7/11